MGTIKKTVHGALFYVACIFGMAAMLVMLFAEFVCGPEPELKPESDERLK